MNEEDFKVPAALVLAFDEFVGDELLLPLVFPPARVANAASRPSREHGKAER